MDDFSYLSVVTSIVLGLGVAQLLTGAARLVQARRRVRLYAPTVLWAAFLFLLHIQLWWAASVWRRVTEWTFLGFLLTVMLPVMSFLLAVLVLPDFDRPGTLDLREIYYENSRWFFGCMAALIALTFAQELVVDGTVDRDADTVFKVVFLMLNVGAAATRSRWYHESYAPVAFLAFVGYIATLFPSLATID